jgi:uncharacterized membrane protein
MSTLANQHQSRVWDLIKGVVTRLKRVRRSMDLSIVGLLVGTVFFAFSLTPSLLPRPFVIQGVISGLSFGAGYALGVFGEWLWNLLQLPAATPRTARLIRNISAGVCALVAVSFLWQASEWQNTIRDLMGMERSAGGHWVFVGLIAIALFLLLLGLTRLFRAVFQTISRRLGHFLPPRIAALVGIAASLFLFWSIIEGFLVSAALRTADRSFQQLDALIEDDLPLPQRADQTGSAQSLINWEDLGRQGRRFVAGGPDADELTAFFGEPCPAPLRVYVGLNSAPTQENRAKLALEELKRVGGFDRDVLLLVTPTGTGWVDPGAQDTVEYLHRGNTATVVAQYSYLNSPLALMTEAAYGAEMARLLFREVYGHWRTLPRDQRPRLFLSGLSLGSLNSDISFDLYDIIDDPFDGALWIGPPFSHESWGSATRQRDPGSPAWLPQFRQGAVVRFMNQSGGLENGATPWGPFRIAFLQYASDPIVFFSTRSTLQKPAWMREPRGHDVSPDLRWFPVVTMLQLAADMMVGTAPSGFGHEYAARDYLEAWRALTEPIGISEEELENIREKFE